MGITLGTWTSTAPGLCDDSDIRPQTYWINSSGNSLVRRLISKADSSTKDEIERLIAGETIVKSIRLDMTYDEIESTIDNMWRFY